MVSELEKLLRIIENDKIKLKENNEVRNIYLLGITSKRNLYDDFLLMYNSSTEFQRNLANKLMDETAEQNYLVVVNSKGRIEGIFNRKFAEYDKETQTINVRTEEQVLLEYVQIKKEKKNEQQKKDTSEKLIPKPVILPKDIPPATILYGIIPERDTAEPTHPSVDERPIQILYGIIPGRRRPGCFPHFPRDIIIKYGIIGE